MIRKATTFVVLGALGIGAMFAAGCASNESKPYGLTGQSTLTEQERKEQMRYTDSKGHYRPDLQMMNLPQRP